MPRARNFDTALALILAVVASLLLCGLAERWGLCVSPHRPESANAGVSR
jgi:hypothetical protein